MDFENLGIDGAKRVSIELGTRLQFVIEGVEGNFKSHLIGMEPEKYLVIRAPLSTPYGSIRHKFFRGNKVVVRYLYKGTVFGFQSELIEDLYAPLKLLFLKYPQIIEEHNLRSSERVSCLLPIRTRFKEGEDEVDGFITDLSEMGCCSVYKRVKGRRLPSVDIEDPLTILCQFPKVGSEQIIPGRVKTTKNDKDHLSLGIMFTEVDPKLRNIIVQYITAVRELSNFD
jgi:c-di-GMP-binding flagellar brake protein YcgR